MLFDTRCFTVGQIIKICACSILSALGFIGLLFVRDVGRCSVGCLVLMAPVLILFVFTNVDFIFYQDCDFGMKYSA